MAVDGQDSGAELEFRRSRGEVRERRQPRRGWLVVRPHRVVSETRALPREITSEPGVETGGDAEPTANPHGGARLHLAHGHGHG